MPPIILVHGLLGTPETHFGKCRGWWTSPVSQVTLPGHGGSSVVDSPTDRAIADLQSLIDRSDAPPLLFGVSYLGVAVAVHAARLATRPVHGIVISGYSLLIGTSALRRWLQAFSAAAERADDDGRLRALHGDRWPELISAVVSELDEGRLVLPGRDDVTNLDAPVLVMNGALLENERRTVEVAAACGADAAVVAGAGHVVPQDAPRTAVALVEEFAERVTAGRTAFHDRGRVPATSEDHSHARSR